MRITIKLTVYPNEFKAEFVAKVDSVVAVFHALIHVLNVFEGRNINFILVYHSFLQLLEHLPAYATFYVEMQDLVIILFICQALYLRLMEVWGPKIRLFVLKDLV